MSHLVSNLSQKGLFLDKLQSSSAACTLHDAYRSSGTGCGENGEVGVSTVSAGPSVTANKGCQDLNHNNGKAIKVPAIMFPLMFPFIKRRLYVAYVAVIHHTSTRVHTRGNAAPYIPSGQPHGNRALQSLGATSPCT